MPAGAVVSSVPSSHHAAAQQQQACYFTASKTDVTAQCAFHCHRLLVKLLYSTSSSLSQVSISHHPLPSSPAFDLPRRPHLHFQFVFFLCHRPIYLFLFTCILVQSTFVNSSIHSQAAHKIRLIALIELNLNLIR